MINIKLHKNEIELIKESIKASKWFGNEPKLCDRVLKKLDKALTTPVVGRSEQLKCEDCGSPLPKGMKHRCYECYDEIYFP